MNDETHRFRERIACISHSSRFEIVLLLSAGDQCVSAVARRIGRSQSCTTRHLQALQRHGLVRGRRDGKQVLFEVCASEPEVRLVLEAARAGLAGDGWAALSATPVAVARPAEAARDRSSAARGTRVRRSASKSRRTRAPHETAGGNGDAYSDSMVAGGDQADPAPAPAGPPPPRQDLEDYLL
jgi:DNA-binding transcriptional ArsR family regulator